MIILLYKKGLKHDAGNYRPISLTNVDYKILAYILTEHLKLVLKDVIHPSQTAYLSGKFIRTNIHKVQDMINLAQSAEKEWIVLFLDFRKAFDSVSHLFLMTMLRTMGFPPNYIAWILVLYNGASSMVKNNGWLSSKFHLGRGVRQGCPLSCHLFNLVGQIMVYYLQSMGIFAWWTYTSDPSSLYANDVALILEHTGVLPRVIELIQYCGHFTGLKLNLSKTVAYAPSINKPVITAGVRVSSEPVKYLGSYLGDHKTAEDLNFSNALAKMRDISSRWKCHSLTLKA